MGIIGTMCLLLLQNNTNIQYDKFNQDQKNALKELQGL